ncbi:hypothetical protein AVEN_153335-1 [Araneus ventricosus]|uniref:Uncharacterized protein n=1 Tax=Araneus ventricosus TaxID=182803 RepID=A0A4Y2M6W1_ARAVE|nr:hypothetical protein AVEN_153335-1 [Araneus ventricosus]
MSRTSPAAAEMRAATSSTESTGPRTPMSAFDPRHDSQQILIYATLEARLPSKQGILLFASLFQGTFHFSFRFQSRRNSKLANADFQRDRCSRNLQFNALYRMRKAFRTLQYYAILIRLCVPYKFVALVANHLVCMDEQRDFQLTGLVQNFTCSFLRF